MDIPLALEVLKPGLYWGPNANTSNTYAELASTWPAASGAIPTEAQMESAWAQILTERPELIDGVIAEKKRAKELLDQLAATGRILKAIVGLTVDELNAVRQWLTALKSATAGASTYAAFRTAVTALASMPNRNDDQARAAVRNRVDAQA